MTIKKKIYFSISSLALSGVLIIVFAVRPILQGIQSSSRELVSQREKLASLEEKSANLKEAKILYDDFATEVGRSDNLFIDSKMPVEFIGFLEKTAKDSDVKIKIFPLPSRQEKEDSWPSLSFQIESGSSFFGLMKFLEKIEAAPYLMEVANLNIVRNSQAKEGTGGVQAIFSVKVYAK